jgi:hypothetical protein
MIFGIIPPNARHINANTYRSVAPFYGSILAAVLTRRPSASASIQLIAKNTTKSYPINSC